MHFTFRAVLLCFFLEVKGHSDHVAELTWISKTLIFLFFFLRKVCQLKGTYTVKMKHRTDIAVLFVFFFILLSRGRVLHQYFQPLASVRLVYISQELAEAHRKSSVKTLLHGKLPSKHLGMVVKQH